MAVALGNITSADATFTLTIQDLFTSPQAIQQFGVEDAFDSEGVENAEVVKGVDGIMTAGYLPTLPKLNVTLMANSPSGEIFDQWFQTEQQQRQILYGQGVISVPGISRRYTLLNAVLSTFIHLPPAKKTMQPRKFVLTLDDIQWAPL